MLQFLNSCWTNIPVISDELNALIAAHEEDTKKCLDVLASYEDERCLPSDRTLRYTAKVLESCGEEVPFTVPEITQVWNPCKGNIVLIPRRL